MTWRSWTTCAMAALSLAGMALLCGCPTGEQPEQTVVSPAPTAPQPTPAPTAPAQFEYTETPSVEGIPNGPITGMIHGQPFTAKTIRVERENEDTFEMQISDGELSDPDNISSAIDDDNGWSFRFTVDEGSLAAIQWGIEDEKKFEDEKVYCWYQDEGKKITVVGGWGAALEITDWTVEEPSAGSRTIGTMKGRLALVMRDPDDSWAAGEFEAPVFKW